MMDARYPEYPQHNHSRSRRYSNAPSSPLPPSYDSTSPTRPEPAASPSRRDARERRRKERLNGPRSVPHTGATCDNDFCDDPKIPEDERLCLGPDGLNLCSRCYKRFKLERRRAREAQRAMTDDWMKPRRKRSKSQTISGEDPDRPAAAIANNNRSSERSQRDPPLPTEKTHADRNSNKYREKSPRHELEVSETSEQPASFSTPLPQNEKNPSLYNFSASSLKEYARKTSRPRKHHSDRGRENRGHVRHGHARDMSAYEEDEFYKYGRAEENDDYHHHHDRRCCCSGWSRRRKCVILGFVVSLIVLIIIIVLAVTLSRKDKFNYTPSFAQVNSTEAFTSGGATRKNVNDTDDGIGAGTDSYTYYQGKASNFPPKEQWISFKDMWDNNLDTFKSSCGWLKRGDNNTPEMIQDIYNAIQDRANASLVDHRIILATIIQETNGCPLSPPTTSSGGTLNPGLMQSHNGHAYDPKHSRLSILLMVQDGTQGTEHGWGLVDNLNTYGNPYKAMRAYNSGYIPTSGDLSEAAGATACYVTDIANRLTGWVRADSKCPGDG